MTTSAGRAKTETNFHILSITVPHVSLKHGPKSGSQFAVFELKVEAHSSGQRLQWTHHRRYTDFVELHNKLTRYNFVDLPDLPAKRLLNNLSEHFLQQRREQLELYLQQTNCTSEASKCPSFMNFIGAVQFIDTSNADSREITSFPYTMRSGRYAGPGSKPAVGEDSCRVCAIS